MKQLLTVAEVFHQLQIVSIFGAKESPFF